MTYPVKSPRKLIEVALPLDAINVASVRESYIYRGNPSSLHKWWAQRPLAAARAVIFAQMVNDPSWKWEMENPGQIPPGHLKASWAASRKRIFEIIEELVKWENTTNEVVLERARAEIRRSWREVCELNKDHPQAAELFDPEKLPALHDPFAGGGTIPLEAQRLGLEAYASDLNPVAVLINKAMIEIPPKFAGMAPVNPEARKPENALGKAWQGAAGLADDVRYYGAWMCEEAQKRIGHLYPKVEITVEMAQERPDLKPLVGQKLTVLAWLWTRTVKSPNPAFSHVQVPLTSTFVLSTKSERQVHVQPTVSDDEYYFEVRLGKPPNEAFNGTKSRGRDASFRCLVSGAPISGNYIKSEAQAGRMGLRLLAAVVIGTQGRMYLPAMDTMVSVALSAEPSWMPEVEFYQQALGFRVGNYGMSKWSDLFTRRQLVAMTTFSELVSDAREFIRCDAAKGGLADDEIGTSDGGQGARAYAEAVGLYLAFAVNKHAMYGNVLVPWYTKEDRPSMLFTQQTVPMVWDPVELNPFSGVGGSFAKSILIVADSLEGLPNTFANAHAFQQSAADSYKLHYQIVSTDPPYYDNVGYADLSDFFYVWLRISQKDVFPELFSTIVVPKSEELVATPGRHGGQTQAESFFLTGMTTAIQIIANQSHPAFPVTIYYAFRQVDNQKNEGTANTGWETFLDSVIRAGFALSGTWPMRTERTGRMRDNASNALASSIVLVCRKRPADAPTTSRREFLRELNSVLPEALDEMTKGAGDDRSPVAPVDLSQAIIGPGMAVFSKYAAVLEADGTPMSVRTALQLINRFLAEDDFDADTQFCLHWFDQYGWRAGPYGEADVLARAKGTSVGGVQSAGVVEAGGGSVRLRKWTEYPTDWDPTADARNPVWETLHHLIRALRQEGETPAGALLAAVQGKGEATRQLAYRLYTLCERQGWAEDARAYNELITSWGGIEAAASSSPVESMQGRLFE